MKNKIYKPISPKHFNDETILPMFKRTPEYAFILDRYDNIVFYNDNIANFAQITDKSDLGKLRESSDIFYKSISRINSQIENRRTHGMRTDSMNPEYIEISNYLGEKFIMSLLYSVYEEESNYYRLVLLSDHTNISMKEKELIHMASVDYLTKAYNRRHMMAIIEKEFLRFERNHNINLSLMFLDLDFFKNVNDKYGHHAGDSVLIDFANIVIDRLRKYDNFGRMGGEEFCISLTDTNAQQAGILAKDLLDRIRSSEVKHNSDEQDKQIIKYTCSIGISTLSPEFNTIDQWLDAADKALYLAKNSGRDRYCHFLEIKENKDIEGYSSSLKNN